MSAPASIAGDDATLMRILAETRTIALIGASPHPWRDSHMVMAYLQQHGFRVIPVNPKALGTLILDEPVHADLSTIDARVDMVDVFRNSDAAAEAIDSAIVAKEALQLRSVWLQLGVRNDRAAARACAAGLNVVMDLCIKIEHRRLGGPGGGATQSIRRL